MTVELPELPDACWPVDTSCVPLWDALEDPDEPEGEDNPPVYSPEDKARAVAWAGQTMRLLTGYRVGGCPVTARPCRVRCADQTWRTYPVTGSSPWQPISLGGSWINVVCGHGAACGCTTVHEVQLPGAGAVTEVLIDGVTLDPSAYRLDPGGWLVRTDGDPWPVCQDVSRPATEAGTWAVTYLPAVPVDGLGAYAAGLLAGEYVKACAGDSSCALPETVTQVARQGVTFTITAGTFPDNRTGIMAVDQYVERWNPHALVAPSVVWSPDVRRPRRTS